MSIKQKLEEIDKYFENLSTKEFENILERNGINEISSKSKENMMFASDINTGSYRKKS